MRQLNVVRETIVWNTKGKCTLHLDSLYNFDSVLKMKKMNYPQVYLEECKYKTKKINMSKFINTDLKSESE